MTWKESIKETLLNPVVAVLYGFFLPVMILGAIHKSAESTVCAIVAVMIVAFIITLIVLNRDLHKLFPKKYEQLEKEENYGNKNTN